jgi:hypothetical protein
MDPISKGISPTSAGAAPPSSVDPTPEPRPDLVVRWLRRVRMGALIALAAKLACMPLFALACRGITLTTRALNTVSCATIFAGAVSVWLLVLPEPGKNREHWIPRWVLRMTAISAIGVAVVSIVFFGILGQPMPGDDAAEPGYAYDVFLLGICATLYWYLRELAKRVNDALLRKNFTVLLSLTLTGILLLGLLWVNCPSEAFAWNATARPGGHTNTPGLLMGQIALFLLVFLWPAWLMFRLSRRLKAAEYLPLQVQIEPTPWPGSET